MRPETMLREASASARSQPVASILTVLMVAGMVLAVLLTTGRTVGAARDVLTSIDDAGTRSIVIRADDSAGITSDVLNRIDRIEGIEWAGAFSSAVDATNTLVADGTRVPVRYAYGDLEPLGIPTAFPLPGQVAFGSAQALTEFGLVQDAGSITLTNGLSYAVAGRIETPDYLDILAPLVLIPQPVAAGTESVNIVVIVATSPARVASVADAVVTVLAATDATKVTVETSEALAQIRQLVQRQLGTFSHGLVLAILALTSALVAILQYGLVTMRRKDFGRRRALGASRGFIITLLLTQTALLSLTGIIAGTIVGAAAIVLSGDPLPGADFIIALVVLGILTSLIGSLIPAIVASRKEPIRELRVP